MERKERIIFAVSKEEKETLEEAAAKRGLSVSAYIRQRLIYEGEK